MKNLGSALRGMRTEAAKFFAENQLQGLPIRRNVRGYSKGTLRKDLKAGMDVALLAVPQGMAYAAIAGLDVLYGITCSAVAAIIAPFFASSRHTILGPTNATAFMIMSSMGAIAVHKVDKEMLMPMLVLMVGIILVVGAFFRFADLIQYISRSVVVGYITGAAVLITANQLKHVFGVDDSEITGRTFFTILVGVVKALGTAQWRPMLLAVMTGVLYWTASKKFPRFPSFAGVMVVMSLVNYLMNLGVGGNQAVTVEAYSISDLGLKVPDLGDQFLLDSISPLFGVAFAVAFLASLEHSVMSKTLGSRTGHHPDMNQDMLSVGISNIWAAFLSGMPASGSLTRSALNHESGAVTPVSSIISGLICVVGAFTLGGLVSYVPKSVLAALVICIAVSLINTRNLRICFKATRSDATVLVSTLAATLVMPLHVAIFTGVGLSVILYLRKAARPHLVEYEFNDQGDLLEAEKSKERRLPGISIVHVEGELFFGAAELFRTQIQRTAQDPNLRVIVLRLKNARHLDATSVMALEELIRFLESQGRHLLISGAMKDVYRVLRDSGMIDVIGRDNIFMGAPSNPNISTRNALKRAQELLGTKQAEVHIFYDPSKDKKS